MLFARALTNFSVDALSVWSISLDIEHK